MHDGRTRRVESDAATGSPPFLEDHDVSLTVLTGPAAGMEFALDSPRVIAGRSDRARIRLDFDSISAEHAAFELDENGFGVRDLASTNGVQVNGKEVLSHGLTHGDRVRLGECELQYVLVERDRGPKAIQIDETG